MSIFYLQGEIGERAATNVEVPFSPLYLTVDLNKETLKKLGQFRIEL